MMTEREQQTILGPKSQIFLWIKFHFFGITITDPIVLIQ